MRRALAVLLLLAVAGGGAFWWLTEPERIEAAALQGQGGDPDAGRLVYFAAGCGSCHATPGGDDPLALGGGLALTTDFGTFHAPNVSSHPQAGIGGWSEADFVNAVMRGVSPGGGHYYPAFPYASYARMQVADARDLFAFMRTLPAVDTPSRPHDLAFPYSVSRGVGLWKLIYLETSPLELDAAAPEAVRRGAYLVEALGHCAECHSDRDALGGIRPATRLAGGPNPEGRGFIPNITPHEDGLADWEEADIAAFMADGFKPDGDVVGGSMAAVVRNTGELPEQDRAAIAAYLKSVAAKPTTPRDQSR